MSQEELFLREIDAEPGNQAARLIYADWLEERGDLRADFIRILARLQETDETDPEFDRLHARKESLRDSIDVAWQQRLGYLRFKEHDADVESCEEIENYDPTTDRFRIDYACPVEWNNLRLTEEEDVRYCGHCEQRVHYCKTEKALESHVQRGHCVAMQRPDYSGLMGFISISDADQYRIDKARQEEAREPSDTE
ncbi:MAG: TIGR02996 domain-containing protein [Planctomycetales bacterium]